MSKYQIKGDLGWVLVEQPTMQAVKNWLQENAYKKSAVWRLKQTGEMLIIRSKSWH